jgi:hypothetical protein
MECGAHENKHLLIDSASHVFDQFYYNYLHTIDILIDEKRLTTRRTLISEKKFLYDCLNLLISVPSLTFTWYDVSSRDSCTHLII